MIILFNKEEKLFQTLGLGVLKDATNCTVTEELNGSFELEMEYPLTGNHYSDIGLQKLLLVPPNMYDQPQPFRIYSISKPMNGRVLINAEHISYDTSGHVVKAFKANDLKEVMEKIQNEAVPQSSFKFLTDKFTQISMETDQPYSQRSLLAGQEGSLLDIYGGDYKFDRFNIYLLNNRGQDRGLSIRYGKNLIDLEDESSSERLFTGIFPFYSATINETTTSSNSHYQEVWIVEGTVEYAGNWLSLSEGGKALIPIIENSPVQVQTQNPLYYEKVLYFKYAVTGTNQFDVYIRSGASEYSSSWLSKTNGGAALVPEKKIIYRIISEGDYIYNTFIWDGSKYVSFIGTGFYYEYEKNAEGQYIFEEKDEEGHLIIKILKPLLTKITSDTKERKVYLDLTQDELNRWPNGIMYAPGQETTNPQKILTLNMTDKHPEEPSFEEFWSKAEDYMNNNDLQKIVNNLTVSFVKLSDSPEYETFKELEKVELGDKISVIYEKLGVNSKLQVITTVFNVLTNKYDEIELGTKSASLTDSALTTGDSISALTNDANYTDRISVVNLLAQNITADYITGKNANLTEAMIESLKTRKIEVDGLIEASQGVFDKLMSQLLITKDAEITNALKAGTIEVKGKITALSGEIHASISVGRNDDGAGNITYNFEVDRYGNAIAKSLTITGGEIKLGNRGDGTYNFSVNQNGDVKANSFTLHESDPLNPIKTNISISKGKLIAQDAEINGIIRVKEVNFEGQTTLKKVYADSFYHTIEWMYDDIGSYWITNQIYVLKIWPQFYPNNIESYNRLFHDATVTVRLNGTSNTGSTVQSSRPVSTVQAAAYHNENNPRLISCSFSVAMNTSIRPTFAEFFAPSGETIHESNDRLELDANFAPSLSNAFNLGTVGKQWYNIYTNKTYTIDIYSVNALIQTSDEKEKEEINYDISKYEKFFDLLKPSSFKFSNGESGRTHLGFISQDIEKALEECNLSTLDFAGFIKTLQPQDTTTEDSRNNLIENNYKYGLRYGELHALEIQQIQQLKQQVKELQEIILKKEE